MPPHRSHRCRSTCSLEPIPDVSFGVRPGLGQDLLAISDCGAEWSVRDRLLIRGPQRHHLSCYCSVVLSPTQVHSEQGGSCSCKRPHEPMGDDAMVDHSLSPCSPRGENSLTRETLLYPSATSATDSPALRPLTWSRRIPSHRSIHRHRGRQVPAGFRGVTVTPNLGLDRNTSPTAIGLSDMRHGIGGNLHS